MKKTEVALIDKINKHLFESSETAEQSLSPSEMQIKIRWMALYAKNLDNPLMTTTKKIEFLQSGGSGTFAPVSLATAYSDIRAINHLLGNIQTAHKNWIRHVFTEKLLEVISKTEDDEDKYNVIYALDKLGKYWKLDKDDADHVDFSKIIPPSFEPSDDITLVKGVVKIENIDEYRKCLRQRLGVTTKNIQDAQIIEFSDGESA